MSSLIFFVLLALKEWKRDIDGNTLKRSPFTVPSLKPVDTKNNKSVGLLPSATATGWFYGNHKSNGDGRHHNSNRDRVENGLPLTRTGLLQREQPSFNAEGADGEVIPIIFILWPLYQQINPTCPPGYSNFGLTGIPSSSFTAMLQGTSLPSPHLNQNSSAGYPPGQYHHAMFSNLNQNSIAENPSDQYHPAMFSNLGENSSVAYPSSQYDLPMFSNLSENSTACTRLEDYDSGQ